VPRPEDIVTFLEPAPPPGASPLVEGELPDWSGVELVEHQEGWARTYDDLAARVRQALGFRVLGLHHVGSTAVPDLVAKPIVDVALVVADPEEEDRYVPPLAAAGFRLRIREPWWYGHRMLRSEEPRANLHVFGPDSPEPMRNVLFRDWLRKDAQDRALYAAAKVAAAEASNARGEHVMDYNARKQAVVREICTRAFAAAGLR
jgi:GrpB-like predicted nucleotidyltransferase (UPF0157 family)